MADVLNTESLDSLVEAAAALVDQLKQNEALIGRLVETVDTFKTEADSQTETFESGDTNIDLVHRHLANKYPEFSNVTGHIGEGTNDDESSHTVTSDIAMLEKMVESRKKRNVALCEILDNYDHFLHTECVPQLTLRLRNDSAADAVLVETAMHQKHRLTRHRLWPVYKEYLEMMEALGEAETTLTQVNLLDDTTFVNLITLKRIAALETS